MTTTPTPAGAPAPALSKTLGPVMLWGLGVGYVISGEYFGWNLGLPHGGTLGMFAATVLVTVMYVAFVFSYAELACALPHAGGAFVYATEALGPTAGFLAGIFQFVEFVFAPPAIALAIGAYLHIYAPGVDARVFALAAYVLLTALNVWGVKQAATFELFVTVIAVAELLVFIVATLPAFRWENVTRDALPNGWGGAFAALPFAIWFYLAIEGVANAAEEAKNPQRDVARGFGSAIATLVVLALAVFFTAVGAAGWKAIVFAPDGSTSDSPLPMAMAHAVSTASPLYAMLVGVGLFGLLASFHGILLAAGRASMSLGKAGYLPHALGNVHPKTHTPVVALVVNACIGAVAVLSGQTGFIITLSVFGALCLYVVSMVALFALRRKQPALERPFHAVAYPVFPAIALVLAVICVVATVWSYPVEAAVFAGVLAASMGFYGVRRRLTA